jgi:hypothetical protein
MRQLLRVATLVTLATAVAGAAVAQVPAPPEFPGFVTISAGSQLQSRTFTDTTSFGLFNELATVSASQKVGRGFVFDVAGGFRVWKNVSLGLGIWTLHASGDAAVTAVIPDPLVFGRPTTSSLVVTDAAHTAVGVDFQVRYSWKVANTVDMSVFIGPTIVHVTQDIASVAVASGGQTPTGSLNSESATSGKAGNVGLDITYRLTRRLGVGVFARYAGGEADLPSAPKLKVGGVQAGAGLRVRF